MRSKKILTATLTLFLVTGISAFFIGWIKKDPIPLDKDIRQAVAKSLPLLQISGHKFIMGNKRHCTSCHNNLLTGLLEEKMMLKGLPATDSFRTERIQSTNLVLRFACNTNDPDNFVPAKFIVPYALIGLDADHGPANPYTDIAVDYILNQQHPDGSFHAEAGRPPHETGEAHLAAIAIRSIQLYAAPAKKARVTQEVALTKQFLLNYSANTQQELVFQLLGLQWCGATTAEKEKVAARLHAIQNIDGSWSQLPSMTGDAYATGEALYALSESGTTRPEEAWIQKSIAWLLKNQDPSGAWIVETRAYPIQPFFNSDFPPYDENQFISAAATNWASLALLTALPDAK